MSIPLGLLTKHVYDQLRMEAFLRLRLDADDLALAIDRRAGELIATEEGRRFEEFNFLNVVGNAAQNSLVLSPLSRFPSETRLPGVVGYFQLDPGGEFSSPLLPREARSAPAVLRYGIDAPGFQRRRAQERKMLDILHDNDIARRPGPAATDLVEEQLQKTKAGIWSGKAGAASAASKTMNSMDDIPLEAEAASAASMQRKKQSPDYGQKYESRKEQVALPEQGEAQKDGGAATVRTFESEIDPFQFVLLTSGHPILYRKVWRDKQRYIQGALMDREPFFAALIEQPYARSSLADVGVGLSVRHGNDDIRTFGRSSPRLLARHKLRAPFDDVELVFTVARLPTGPSVYYAFVVSALLGGVLAIGFVVIYAAGRRQIALAEQQRDFVSAVSHELKTPLTSIRMYSEMLREGWATEDKKRTYYDFIFNESERLSRLIANVLQLARFSSRGQEMALQDLSVAAAYRKARDVVATQVANAGFTLREPAPGGDDGKMLRVDPDALTQIFVNLVDNAIKFSAKSGQSVVEAGYELSPTGREVRFFVRDFGAGIARDQLKKIFQLFYRAEDELTRATKGTGIGLALVRELAVRMGGSVDVESRPGLTEFRVILPVLGSDEGR